MALVVFPKGTLKEDVLLKLWNCARFISDNHLKKDLSLNKSRELVAKFNKFGQVAGKALNVNFKHFPAIIQIDYDKINGYGLMQQVAYFFYKKKGLITNSNVDNSIIPNRQRTTKKDNQEWELIDLVPNSDDEPEEIL